MSSEPTGAEAPAPRWSLGAAYSGRDNAFNVLRLVFAFMVLAGHSNILGFGIFPNPFGLDADLGGLAVMGFFALSGFLITRSGRRGSFVRYWWHRILRIFPALWVCLLLTALVIVPVLWVDRHDTLAGYFSASPGPVQYIRWNFYGDVRQGWIGDVLWGRPNGVLNGSLWTLKYELTCYGLVSALALTGILRRARWVVGLLTLAGLAVLGWDFAHDPLRVGPAVTAEAHFTLPVAGTYLTFQVLTLTVAFLLGACAELYRDRLPLHDALGGLSLVAVAAALYYRLPLLSIALPAYAYLLLWLGVRLPAPVRRLASRNDYSYGVYIYAFLVQQTIGVLFATALGEWSFLLVCTAVTALLAIASWHLVEKPALRLKQWTPSLPARVRSPGD